MSRFVQPETRTLTLANGDTLIVRARLSAGETRAQQQRSYTMQPDGTWVRNPLTSGVSLIVAYLLDWDLRDDRSVTIRNLSPEELSTILDNLDIDSFVEIKSAIEDHVAAMTVERSAQKKTDGAMASSAT